MKLNIFVLGILMIGMIGLVSATEDTINRLDSVKQNDCILIPQVCGSCSYINITITHKNLTMIENQPMIDNGAGWTYSYCNTSDLGRYDIQGKGDVEGVDRGFDALYFEVTPSGNSGTDNLIFFIVVLVLLYGLTLLFFLKRDVDLAPFVTLSGMALGVFGIYMINNGVIIFRDWFTNYLSYVTIGVGFGLALWSLIAWMEEVFN